MLTDMIYEHWRRITLAVILLLCIALSMLACRRWFSSNTNTGSNASPTPQLPPPPAPEQESFQGVNAAPKQILIKLSNCSGVETSRLVAALTEFSKGVTDDGGVVASRATNSCWFLIKSPTLPVSTLMQRFSEAISSERPLVTDSLRATVVHAEPNFHFQVNRLPMDPIDDYAAASPPPPPPSGSPSPVPTASPASTVSPNDGHFQDNNLWGLRNLTRLGVDIHAENAWGFSTGDDKIVVGVIDTGLDYDHPDLSRNVWSAPSAFTVTVGGTAIPCPAGSHGFNAVTSDPSQMCNPLDNSLVSGHGTHVAGIIGAVGNNGLGVVGVNWSTKLLGLKTMGDSGTATSFDIHRAIEFAVQLREVLGDVDANVRVLNASFGFLTSTYDPNLNSLLLREGIELAGGKEILFVASAGENSGNDNDVIAHYPSGYPLPNVLSVTAINKFGDLATISGSLSNHGKTSVHLGAPGKGIYSTYPPSLGDSYYVTSGTSMATPFVSGAAALMLSVSNCSSLKAADLKRLILEGTDLTPALAETVSGGRLNVFESIKRCPPGGP